MLFNIYVCIYRFEFYLENIELHNMNNMIEKFRKYCILKYYYIYLISNTHIYILNVI